MPDTALRPLTFGEILDHAVNLYRRLFVPLVLVQVCCVGWIYPIQVYSAANGQQLGVGYLLIMLASFVLSALASTAVALIISENYLGRTLAALPALRQARRMLGAVITLSLAMGLVLMVSSIPAAGALTAGMAFMLPSALGVPRNPGFGALLMLSGFGLMLVPVAIFAGLAVSTPALVLERLEATQALRRSWALTRGSRLRVIGVLFVTALLISIPFVGVMGVAGAFSAGRTETTVSLLMLSLSYVVSLVVTPLFYCVLTLLYYDLRVRKEAFDLEVLAAAMPS